MKTVFLLNSLSEAFLIHQHYLYLAMQMPECERWQRNISNQWQCELRTQVTGSFTPTSKVSWKVEAFSLCMVFTSPNSSKRSPMERRAPAQSSSWDRCTWGPSLRNNTNTVAVQVLLMYLFHTLYTRYAGIAHHRVLQTSGRGWADSKAVHGMECREGAHALLEIPLSRGCCLMCTILPVQEGVLTHMTEC